MNLPDKPQPSSNESLTVQKSALIFSNTLDLILAKQSPFADALFIEKISKKYLDENNKSNYFTTSDGLYAYIIVNDDGVAEPSIDLNIHEGLKSRNLRQRVVYRLGKENPTDEEIFQFAVGHELGHLIQGELTCECLEDYDLTGFSEADIKVFEWKLERKNERNKENKDIVAAQEYFRQIFKDDISRGDYETPTDRNNYTNEEYLRYVYSSSEVNADFISLWIMGMNNPNMKTSPQNEGYSLKDWKKWAEDHKIEAIHLA